MAPCVTVVRRAVMPMLVLLLAAVAPARAQDADDDFEGFRIPDHRWRTGSLGVGAGFARQRLAFEIVGGNTVRSEELAGNFSVSAAWHRDSDPVQHTLEASGSLLANRSRFRSHETLWVGRTRDREDRERAVREGVRLLAEWRRYPSDLPAAVGVTGSLDADLGQGWSDEDEIETLISRTVSEVDRETWSYRYRARSTVFAGVGRVRDATGVFDAHTLETRLLATGALTRPLSPAARARLAALFYLEAALGEVLERPDKRFWKEVERVLREDGGLRAEEMDAYDVHRAVENLGPVVRLVRRRGWFIGPTVGADWRNEIHRAESHFGFRRFDADTLTSEARSTSSNRLAFEDSQITAGLRAEMHRPLGWRWQLDAESALSFPLQRVREGFDTASALTVTYLIADRWHVSGFASHARAFAKPDVGRSLDRWLAAGGVEVAWYLEDRLRATLAFIGQREHDRAIKLDRRDERLNLGLSYAFLRGLDAPGLIEPVRVR